MLVCQIFSWFVVYGVVGWIWESTYCTIVEHRWQNRGFLYGPICPIYGIGIVGIMLLWHHALETGNVLTWYQIFLIVMIGSAILEYVTHWALEKLFHAYWWDYSNMPLNLNGRICLPASVFFGLGGLFIINVLYKPTVSLIASADPLAIEFVSLVLMAAIAADTAITASSLATIAHTAKAINQGVNDHMDRFVLDVQERGAAVAEGIEGRRAETAQAVRAAATTLHERETQAASTLARERDRFAARMRESSLGQMSAQVRSAAGRAMGAVSPDRLPDTPEREQLAQLWRDMLEH